MGRRASSSINPGIIAAIAAAAIGIAAVAFFLLREESEDAAPFPALGFQQEGGRMYAGNRFLLSGTLQNRHLEGEREIAIIAVDTETGKVPVPVAIPTEVKSINIERNSSYDCLVEVDMDGTPVALEIRNR